MPDIGRRPGTARRRHSGKRPGPGAAVALEGGAAKAARAESRQRYVLRLYVTGMTPNSRRAIEGVKTICEEHLHGRYQLEVIDIYQLPALARDEQIVATPTLIKVLPAPLRRFIGNLSNIEKVIFGLDLREEGP